MCTGLEIMGAISAAMSVMGALNKPKQQQQQQPEVVRTDPVADDLSAQTKAAQDAQAATLATRKRLRSNSLLSEAGAAGDNSIADVTKTGAKAVLGA
jgi:uncharacterized protein YlxW (UPF0749 family)